VGPAGTRTTTFIVAKKPPRRAREIRRVRKRWYKNLNPDDTPLGNDAKKRKIPTLVMWYLPVIDRLRRIFMNPKEAALMTWWDDERKVDDDVIAHPADGSQWTLMITIN
jgi:hypothetical protein